MACINPYYVKDRDYYAPCRQCYYCKKKRISEWIIRLLDQYTSYKGRASFLTLTYDNEHLSNYSLCHRHVQLYIKRLRACLGLKLKYFVAGEYGSITNRPHYHMILFGISPAEYLACCSTGELSRRDNSVTISDRYWTYGSNTVGIDCCESALRYTAKYINKLDYGQARTIKYHKRNPPYQRSSQGLGLEFALENSEILRENKYISRNGLKLGLPTYYKNKLDLDVTDYIKQINKRNDDIIKILQDQYGCNKPFETDPNLIDIYNRNPADSPYHLTYFLPLPDIKKSDSNDEKICYKSLKKYLTQEASDVYNKYKREVHYSLKNKISISDKQSI